MTRLRWLPWLGAAWPLVVAGVGLFAVATARYLERIHIVVGITFVVALLGPVLCILSLRVARGLYRPLLVLPLTYNLVLVGWLGRALFRVFQ